MITVDFKRLSIKPGFKILDIGCGSGRHVSEAYRYKDVKVVGIDLNYNDLMDATKRLNFHDNLGAHGGGVWGLSHANSLNLPFQDETFDLVICSEVIEHIPDDHIAIKEMIRVLKPGQNLIVSVPKNFPERMCWKLSEAYHQANQGHVRIYKKKKLIKLIERFGACQWSEHHAHSLHSPYWWLKCLVGPTRKDSWFVNQYHRLLVWDMMKKPKITRLIENILNPILGKSLVLYFSKE